MKAKSSTHHSQSASSLEKNDTKHALRLANDSAWARVVLCLESKFQQLRYAFGRRDLKESTLYGAIMHQTKDGWLSNADCNFPGLEFIPANRFSPLHFHFAISIRPHALTNRMTASAITAPLRADRGYSA